MDRGIITVVGKDSVGIIAKTCTYLADKSINILDISQTILDGYFNMMMIIDITNRDDFDTISKDLEKLGEEVGVFIKLQHENIFNMMHRL